MSVLRCAIENGIIHCKGRKIILNGCDWVRVSGCGDHFQTSTLAPAKSYAFMPKQVDRKTFVCEPGCTDPPVEIHKIRIGLPRIWCPELFWILHDYYREQMKLVFLISVRFGLDHSVATKIAQHLFQIWVSNDTRDTRW